MYNTRRQQFLEFESAEYSQTNASTSYLLSRLVLLMESSNEYKDKERRMRMQMADDDDGRSRSTFTFIWRPQLQGCEVLFGKRQKANHSWLSTVCSTSLVRLLHGG